MTHYFHRFGERAALAVAFILILAIVLAAL